MKWRNNIASVGKCVDFHPADKGWPRSTLYRCQLYEFIIIIVNVD